jgi:hypothetical protein
VRDNESGKPLIWDEIDGKAKTYDDPTLNKPALLGKYMVNEIGCYPSFQVLKEHLKQFEPGWASRSRAGRDGKRMPILDALSKLAEYYHGNLAKSAAARAYLTRRGINQKTIDEFDFEHLQTRQKVRRA